MKREEAWKDWKKQTYTDHQPVSITAAPPGWRAAYIIDPNEDSETGWCAEPVVAFAACHVTERPAIGSTASTIDNGVELHAIVYDEYLQCAEQTSNYWRLIRPGESDPTPDEVQAERRLQKRPPDGLD